MNNDNDLRFAKRGLPVKVFYQLKLVSVMRYIATVTSVLCWLVSIICMRKMRKLMAANCEILVLCVLFNSRHTNRCLSLIWVLYACMYTKILNMGVVCLYVCKDSNFRIPHAYAYAQKGLEQ